MRVHLHTVCWNDAPNLEFFFRHYEPWVDHFWIYDDGSTDGGLEILKARSDVSVEPLVRSDPQSWVMSAKRIYDTCWHRSRSKADWVVIPNVDEHLHHPEMRNYLDDMLRCGVSTIPALGYQMISRDVPRSGSLLWRDYPMGAPWRKMSKVQIFRPDAIRKTDFAPGRHSVVLDGDVVLPERVDVINLHYKYLGFDETYARHSKQGERLGSVDIQEGWGAKYLWEAEKYAADFIKFEQRVVNTRDIPDHDAGHTETRWWQDLY